MTSRRAQRIEDLPVGTQVRYRRPDGTHPDSRLPADGALGAVKAADDYSLSVEFDSPFAAAHGCDGRTAPDRGFWFLADTGRVKVSCVTNLEIVEPAASEPARPFEVGARVVTTRETRFGVVTLPGGTRGVVREVTPLRTTVERTGAEAAVHVFEFGPHWRPLDALARDDDCRVCASATGLVEPGLCAACRNDAMNAPDTAKRGPKPVQSDDDRTRVLARAYGMGVARMSDLATTKAPAPPPPRCRPDMAHAAPCGPTPSDEDCACGCGADEHWCMEDLPVVRPATPPQTEAPAPSWDHDPAECADAGDGGDQRRACDGRHRVVGGPAPDVFGIALAHVFAAGDETWETHLVSDWDGPQSEPGRTVSRLPPAKPRPSMRGAGEDEIADLLADDAP